jgi:hypothetical protein
MYFYREDDMLRRAFSITRSSAADGEASGRLRSWWRSLFTSHHGREDIRHLPPYLLRDIGISERRAPERERDLR